MNARIQANPSPEEEREPLAVQLSVGTRLRQARTDKGMSRQDVANALNLKPSVVAALEEGNYDDLPEMAYVRGYVRGYARLVGLSESEVLEFFPELQVSNLGEAR